MDVIRFGSLVLECSWKSLNNIENYIHVFSKSAKCIIANENQKKSCNREFKIHVTTVEKVYRSISYGEGEMHKCLNW